jgi:hypothetical protein
MADQTLRFYVIGMAEAIAAVRELPERVQRVVIKRGLSASGGILKKEAVKRVPKDSATLEKNLIVKTSLTRDKKRAYSVVGSRRKVKVAIGEKNAKGDIGVVATFRTKKDGTVAASGQKRFDKAVAAGKSLKYRSPSRYIHLVEKKNKNGRFLKKSIAAKGREAGEAGTAQMQKALVQEVAKMGRK